MRLPVERAAPPLEDALARGGGDDAFGAAERRLEKVGRRAVAVLEPAAVVEINRHAQADQPVDVVVGLEPAAVDGLERGLGRVEVEGIEAEPVPFEVRARQDDGRRVFFGRVRAGLGGERNRLVELAQVVEVARRHERSGWTRLRERHQKRDRQSDMSHGGPSHGRPTAP